MATFYLPYVEIEKFTLLRVLRRDCLFPAFPQRSWTGPEKGTGASFRRCGGSFCSEADDPIGSDAHENSAACDVRQSRAKLYFQSNAARDASARARVGRDTAQASR